jgi:hypothetical protein
MLRNVNPYSNPTSPCSARKLARDRASSSAPSWRAQSSSAGARRLVHVQHRGRDPRVGRAPEDAELLPEGALVDLPPLHAQDARAARRRGRPHTRARQ